MRANDAGPSATLRSLAKAFSHDADRTSGAFPLYRLPSRNPPRDEEGIPNSSSPPLRRFSILTSETTMGRRGRESRAQSVTCKGDGFSRSNHFLDHRRLVTHHALYQIVHVLVDADPMTKVVEREKETSDSERHVRQKDILLRNLALGNQTGTGPSGKGRPDCHSHKTGTRLKHNKCDFCHPPFCVFHKKRTLQIRCELSLCPHRQE